MKIKDIDRVGGFYRGVAATLLTIKNTIEWIMIFIGLLAICGTVLGIILLVGYIAFSIPYGNIWAIVSSAISHHALWFAIGGWIVAGEAIGWGYAIRYNDTSDSFGETFGAIILCAILGLFVWPICGSAYKNYS